jgi:hypothetical protein
MEIKEKLGQLVIEDPGMKVGNYSLQRGLVKKGGE